MSFHGLLQGNRLQPEIAKEWLPRLVPKSAPLRKWETDFLPLLVLMRRGAVPVKVSTGNDFQRKHQRIPRDFYQCWCSILGPVSAFQYCTGNFFAPTENCENLAAQCEIPPHIAQCLIEIVSQRGVSRPFAFFS